MGAGDAADPLVASEPLGKSKLWPEAQTPASSTDSGRVGHGAGAAPATGVPSKFHGFGDNGDRIRLAGKGFFMQGMCYHRILGIFNLDFQR
jgi:hypothetical protein